jgi:hypothetical protein
VFTSGDDDCPSGVNPILGLTLLAGLATATAVLYTVITMMGKRRRRRRSGVQMEDGYEDEDGVFAELIDHVTDVAAAGEFGLD